MNEAGGRLVLVELVDEETIVPRGTRKVVWYVRTGDAWTHPGDLPDATRVALEPRPGTIWMSSTEVKVQPGTRLMRVESDPSQDPARDPLDYLRGEIRGARRRTRRSYYRVTERGDRRPETPKPRKL